MARDGAIGRGSARLLAAWSRLGFDQRLAAGAASGIVLTMFLPWYEETLVSARVGIPVSATVSGWSAFSVSEALILIAAIGVLVLFFRRAEGKPLGLPAADPALILGAGAWCFLLVLWRMVDKQTMSVAGPGITTVGTGWGIFVALGLAALLIYAGWRLRERTDDPSVPRTERRPRTGPRPER